MEPETPRLTKAPPGGRSAATREGHEPVAGSLAPTPTASEAPIAMYRRLVLALVGPVRGAAAVVVTGTLAVADRPGTVVPRANAPHEARRHAKRNKDRVRIVRIDGAPVGVTGMRGFDRAGDVIVASRGCRFTLVNQSGSQTTGNTSYALAA